ncbi:MAG: endonuclease [Bacteriovorax sp.]|nr:endonuclease [Bacteriovorax sp.]
MIFRLIFYILLFQITAHAEIKSSLSKSVTETHHPLNYKEANLYLFTKIDNHNGLVCSVYSPSECIKTVVVPSPKIMNVEHTWPQSEGANGIAKSDLHHIFPTSSSTNSMRSSLPFCNVDNIKWEEDQSKRGLNAFGEHCFEPPMAHKGRVARALFYFSIRYQKPIENHQELFLRQWHKEHPVTEEEKERNTSISLYQNNSNPFIENPELVNAIEDF